MEWLEFIRLRTIQARAGRIAGDLKAHIEGLGEEAGLIGTRLYAAVLPDGDFILALFWNTDRVAANGSSVAQRLIPALREHGLVNHTVWVEDREVGLPISAGSSSSGAGKRNGWLNEA